MKNNDEDATTMFNRGWEMAETQIPIGNGIEEKKHLRYLNKKDYLDYAYRALQDHFPARNNFNSFYNEIKTDEKKDKFLKTASFYLFLVKRGDWHVDLDGLDKVVDYLTNSYKYIAIFSLIESLSDKEHIDFYKYLTDKKSQVEFPIENKKKLEGYYKNYNKEYGSIRRCVSFFKSLDEDVQNELITKLQIREKDLSKKDLKIEDLAKYLYDLRSTFMHNADLILQISKGTTITSDERKIAICSLSINDTMNFFEKGLIKHFRSDQDNVG